MTISSFRFVYYQHHNVGGSATGTPQGQIYSFNTFSLTVPRNGVPTLSFTVQDLDTRDGYFVNQRRFQPFEIGFEYFNPATSTWVEPRNCRFIAVRQRRTFGTTEAISYDCVGFGWLLSRRFLAPGGAVGAALNEAGEITVVNQTPGWVLSNPGIPTTNLPTDCTVTTDSLGAAWAANISRNIARTSSALDLLGELSGDGYLDWWMQGRTLRAVRPGTGNTDKSGTIKFEHGRDMVSYEADFDMSSRIDSAEVYTASDNGTLVGTGTILADPANPVDKNSLWSRFLKVAVSDRSATVADLGKIAGGMLTEGSDQRSAVMSGDSQWIPFVDYTPGTLVKVPTANGWSPSPQTYPGSWPQEDTVVIDSIALVRKTPGEPIETQVTFNTAREENEIFLQQKAAQLSKNLALDPNRVATLESYTPGILTARPQLRVYNPGVITLNQVIPYNNVRKDTHGKWNSTTKSYTVPAAGLWLVQIQYKASAAASSPAQHFQVNGVGQLYSSALPPGAYNGGHLSATLDLPQGAVCRVVENNATYTPQNDSAGSYGTGSNYLHMTYLGPST